MNYPSKETVESLRAQYPPGTKVCLDFMDDVYAPPAGTVGTVRSVDDAGQIHVSWETGGSLSLIPGQDQFHVVEPEKVQDSITVLVVEPGKEPYPKAISRGLESLQTEVGGWIECTYPFEEPVALVVNEEGKINGFPLNRALYDGESPYDIIAGKFLIVQLEDDHFGSMSAELQQKFTEKFRRPEQFIWFGGNLVVIKEEPLTYKQAPEKDFPLHRKDLGER